MSFETEQARIAERKERLERELTEISIALKGEFAKLTGKDRGYTGANNEEWELNLEPVEINPREFQALEKMKVTLPGKTEGKQVEGKPFDRPDVLNVALPGKTEGKQVEGKPFDRPDALNVALPGTCDVKVIGDTAFQTPNLNVQIPENHRLKELKKISFERPMLHVEYPVLPEIPEVNHDRKPVAMWVPDMTPTRNVVDSLLAAIKSWSKE